MHSIRRGARALASFAIACTLSAGAVAQSYPAKSLRLIAPYPPGGGVDATARIVAEALGKALGQQVVVDNRGGASGQIGTEVASKAPNDGYHLLLASVAPNGILPAANPKLPYDTLRDFAPISLAAVSDYILAVHPSMPVKSVPELIALAKARPGQIVFASTGNLGGPHLSGELFKQLAKVDMVHVPYKGGGPATVSILSGETSLIFGSGPTVVPHAKNGRLRLIATTGGQRSKLFPELPTVGDTLPGHEVTQWYGIMVPAGVPAPIRERLHAEVVKAVADPTVVQQLARLGASAQSNTPEAFAAHINAEVAKWKRVIAGAGLKMK